MPQSTTPMPAAERRSQLTRVRDARRSASTAAGIAAERVTIAERERGTSRVREAATHLADNPIESVPPAR
jgi:hypothetical protein